MKNFIALIVSATLAFAAPAFAGWGTRDVIENHEHIPLVRNDGSAMTTEQVKKSIIAGASLISGWSVKDEGPGKLTLTLVVRNKHTAVIAVNYDNKGYSIKYVSSINLDYAVDDGKEVIHHNYTRWINNLMLSIKTVSMGSGI